MGQYTGMYEKSHEKGYITDLYLHARIYQWKAYGFIFAESQFFPHILPTSQILIYLASPKYG